MKKLMLAALAIAIATPAFAGDFPTFSPRAKFDWATAHFQQYCKTGPIKRMTYEQLPDGYKVLMIAATEARVIQGIKDNCRPAPKKPATKSAAR